MADNFGYSAEYLNKDIGYRLWQKLTEALGTGEKVSKQNFKEALKRVWKEQKITANAALTPPPSLLSSDSFYIERPLLEERCLTEILQPGCLLRIKAPLQMGKTELMSKILSYAREQGYRTVELNLRDATTADFSKLDTFLQWLCASITEILQQDYPLVEHWQKSLGNTKIKCRSYFEKYLLAENHPLVLALDKVDKIFPYPEIGGEFLGMLRTWHEDSKNRNLWRQLRLVISHTETYTELDINQSPFNAGTEVNLPDFTVEQVRILARKYGLDWDVDRAMELMKLVGGHPYLVREAIEQLVRENKSLDEVWQTAPTAWGIYRYHLQKHAQNLSANPQLGRAFDKIVLAKEPVQFDSLLNQDIAVKLNDLGLVSLSGKTAMPRYELYRLYFCQRN
jgi:hypothetical protein